MARRSRRAVSGIDLAHDRPCDARVEVPLAPDRSNPKIDRGVPGAFLELWLECVMMKETGKGRKSRIELGYYRTPDRLLRLRRLLWVVAIIATGGLLLAAGIADRPANSHSWSIVPRRIASKGPRGRAPRDVGCELRGLPHRLCTDQQHALGALAPEPVNRGKRKVHELSCRAGAPQKRAEGRCPGMCRVPSRPPRARCLAAGCGQFEPARPVIRICPAIETMAPARSSLPAKIARARRSANSTKTIIPT